MIRGQDELMPSGQVPLGHVPSSLAAMAAKVAIGTGPEGKLPWQDAAAFEAVLARFGAPYPRADRRALVSLWSQYYLAALIIPATISLLRCDRILPVVPGELGVEIADDGTVDRFLLREHGRPSRTGSPRFEPLVRGHIEIFVEGCAALCGLQRRVLWSNAAAILVYALDELMAAPPVIEAARLEAEALLSDPRSPLSKPFHHDGEATRRRICCLRYKLEGVPRCADLCPLDRPRRNSRSR